MILLIIKLSYKLNLNKKIIFLNKYTPTDKNNKYQTRIFYTGH